MEKNESGNQPKQVYLFVYFAKFIAGFLVSWGHFVTSGTVSTDLHDAGITGLSVPLFPKEEHFLWYPDMTLILKLGVPLASVGVVIFFLASGFLTPELQKKYNGQEIPHLLVSRMAKIYPSMLVCTVFIGLILFVGQGVSFPISTYLNTALLAQTWTLSAPITNIIWYLLVLMFFYLIATIVPRFTIKNLTLVYAWLYALVGFSGMFKETTMANQFNEICYVAKFCGIPLLGVAAYCLKDKAWSDRLVCFGWFFFLNLWLLRFEEALHGTEHAYTTVWLYVCAFLVILLAWLIDRAVNWGGKKIVSICMKIDELLLPFYLLHFSFGYNTIFLLRKANISVYVCLLAAYAASLAAAWLASKLTRLLLRAIACLPRLDGIGDIEKKKRK